MVNGTGNTVQSETAPHDAEPSIVNVNLNLKWKHFVAAGGMVASLAGTLLTAGWLALPAKQSDVDLIQKQVVQIQDQVAIVQNVSLNLTNALDRLTVQVQNLADKPPLPKRQR